MGFLKISAEDCALLATLFLASIGLRCNLAANIFRDSAGWRQGESSAHRADGLCHFLPDIARGLLFARADEGRPPRTSRPCDHDPNGCDFCASPCHIVCAVNGPVEKAPVTAREWPWSAGSPAHACWYGWRFRRPARVGADAPSAQTSEARLACVWQICSPSLPGFGVYRFFSTDSSTRLANGVYNFSRP